MSVARSGGGAGAAAGSLPHRFSIYSLAAQVGQVLATRLGYFGDVTPHYHHPSMQQSITTEGRIDKNFYLAVASTRGGSDRRANVLFDFGTPSLTCGRGSSALDAVQNLAAFGGGTFAANRIQKVKEAGRDKCALHPYVFMYRGIRLRGSTFFT
ncbi:hypothetical protein EVAR_23062_1 [Eumeta japonica]|uniref:Uncharacterized protein n=1 Tax=Eumeta variegata TaxID=151549 RepID=A0A4C1VN18_EUMVA|nr:hypothetical protein EVAR_23062_1 [Eumeta japonica]